MKRKLFVLIALVLLISVLGTVLVGCDISGLLPDGGNDTDNGNDTDGDNNSTDNGNDNQNGDNNQDNGDTTPTEPTFVDEVNEFAGSLMGSRKLEKVVGIYVKDGYLRVNASYNDDKMYAIEIEYKTPIASVEEAISRTDIDGIYIGDSYETVPYNSAQALLDSGNFEEGSQMQNYLDEGYNIEVVTAQTGKGKSESVFYIFATYKLTKGEEIKYIQHVISVSLKELSNSQEKNYIESVRDPDARTVREQSFVLLTGDAEEYAKQLYELNTANSNS